MVEEWISVSKLSKLLKMPETTTRRYLSNFEEYFRSEQIGRGKKYHPESIEILQRIAMLYSMDYETSEVKRILADEYAFAIDDGDKNITTTPPPAYDVSGKLDEFQRKQEEFNKQLLQQLYEQQEKIKKLTERHDEEIQETKQLISPEKQRSERFERIMAEHKVKRLLEKEAMNLWKGKPPEERIKKVGWFRTEEDRDKRDSFIKDYVDERFETYLRQEFNLED